MKIKKILVFLLTVLFIFACIAGCSKADLSQENKGDYAAAEDFEENLSDTLTAGSKTPGVNLPSDRKLIRTARMEAETDDLDALLSHLDGRIASLGGYVENRQAHNLTRRRSAELTVRIPAEHMDELIDHISESANVTYHSENVEDITLEYVDTQARILALETERTRLLALLEKAETISDILEIETKLTDVQTELEKVNSRLRLYDNQVDYATVELSVSQVVKYTVVEEQTVWERIASGFSDSLKNMADGTVDFFVFVIACLPYLIPVAVVAALTVLIVKCSKRKKAKKQQRPPQTPPQAEGRDPE